jgi:phage FluMu protein Com
MMLRYTEVMPTRCRAWYINEGINNIAYKCPRCHLLDKFYVPDNEDYLIELLEKKRKGVSLYLPPRKTWEEENEKIRQRLKDLGYM